jgi:hypothetical protein
VTGEPAHGTRRRYQLGCKCPDCTRSNTVYQRHVRAGERGSPSTRMAAFAIDQARPLWEEEL